MSNNNYIEPKAEIQLNIHGQAILQKTVHAGTLQRPAVGLIQDRNTGAWHEEPMMDHEKVLVQATKVYLNTFN